MFDYKDIYQIDINAAAKRGEDRSFPIEFHDFCIVEAIPLETAYSDLFKAQFASVLLISFKSELKGFYTLKSEFWRTLTKYPDLWSAEFCIYWHLDTEIPRASRGATKLTLSM